MASRWTRTSIAGVVRLLLAAGHDSTTSAMGMTLHYLARTPADQARLRAEPGLIPTAIEEMLRFEPPVFAMPRVVAKDVELHGRQLRAGNRVYLYFVSGNRDEAAFEDADRCIVDRRPNPHLAFGYGIHRCVGAPLARLELRVALEEWLRVPARLAWPARSRSRPGTASGRARCRSGSSRTDAPRTERLAA